MNAVRDGESVLMGVTDENECHLWVMALYRATGQSHKPTPPTTSDTHHKIMGGELTIAVYLCAKDINDNVFVNVNNLFNGCVNNVNNTI